MQNSEAYVLQMTHQKLAGVLRLCPYISQGGIRPSDICRKTSSEVKKSWYPQGNGCLSVLLLKAADYVYQQKQGDHVYYVRFCAQRKCDI